MQMDCAGSVKTTDLMADLSILDNNERELSDKYLNEHGKIVGVSSFYVFLNLLFFSTCSCDMFQLFQSWSEEEQLDFMERVLQRMGHYQIGHVDRFIRPMLQRDFIANLPGESLFPNPKSTKISPASREHLEASGRKGPSQL